MLWIPFCFLAPSQCPPWGEYLARWAISIRLGPREGSLWRVLALDSQNPLSRREADDRSYRIPAQLEDCAAD